MSDKKSSGEKSEDTELDELLDSALEDFEKVPKKEEEKEAQREDSNSEAEASGFKLPECLTQLTKTIDQLETEGLDSENPAMQQMLDQDWLSEMMQGMDKLKDLKNNPDFQTAISQALKDLSQTSENLQNNSPLLNEEELAAMFSQAGLDDQRPADILPFMQGMMQSLLSKEVLYPSLKEIVDKYPAWLEEKKDTLETKDFDRYTKQLTLMQKVCVELEAEKDDDSEPTKQQRFERTLSLMQEMQSCGQPPEDLVGEQPPLFPLDTEGNPTFPPGFEPPQNCSLM